MSMDNVVAEEGLLSLSDVASEDHLEPPDSHHNQQARDGEEHHSGAAGEPAVGDDAGVGDLVMEAVEESFDASASSLPASAAAQEPLQPASNGDEAGALDESNATSDWDDDMPSFEAAWKPEPASSAPTDTTAQSSPSHAANSGATSHEDHAATTTPARTAPAGRGLLSRWSPKLQPDSGLGQAFGTSESLTGFGFAAEPHTQALAGQSGGFGFSTGFGGESAFGTAADHATSAAAATTEATPVVATTSTAPVSAKQQATRAAESDIDSRPSTAAVIAQASDAVVRKRTRHRPASGSGVGELWGQRATASVGEGHEAPSDDDLAQAMTTMLQSASHPPTQQQQQQPDPGFTIEDDDDEGAGNNEQETATWAPPHLSTGLAAPSSSLAFMATSAASPTPAALAATVSDTDEAPGTVAGFVPPSSSASASASAATDAAWVGSSATEAPPRHAAAAATPGAANPPPGLASWCPTSRQGTGRPEDSLQHDHTAGSVSHLGQRGLASAAEYLDEASFDSASHSHDETAAAHAAAAFVGPSSPSTPPRGGVSQRPWVQPQSNTQRQREEVGGYVDPPVARPSAPLTAGGTTDVLDDLDLMESIDFDS